MTIEATEKGIAAATSPDQVDLLLNTRRITVFLVVCAILISIAGTIANYFIYQVAEDPQGVLVKIMNRFDLGHEPSLPAWFSSLVLSFNAIWLLLIGMISSRNRDPYANHWLALGVIFVALSIDETVMFHEMIDAALLRVFPGLSALPLPWVLVGGAFALLIFVSYLRFLLNLEQRWQILFILSGAIFVGGAVGVETIAGEIISRHGVESIQHTFIQALEESMEMAGSILFFYSLSEYWNAHFRSVHFGNAK